ncbi:MULTISPECIES: hypothetical protein [Enterococcus]|uniref:Uncharacterized protein n=1 Tax=Enterococcus dongliensis TaxID=2559925 RepID=A0ABU3ES04_9ENTE|nr:hypothetical protein [Enterococcus dongliensis]MDT2597642.1 hypothetical protein [Enterococcus dongliensis]
MIYKKEASFPNPVLSNTSTNYKENDFILDVANLTENEDMYTFEFSYEITSSFVNRLISAGKANLIFVIQSQDNFFKILEKGEKIVSIPKNRLSLSYRTTIQLLIQSVDEINFSECDDLNDFYEEIRDDITIERNNLLGYSNLVVFEGSENKPLELIERKVDPTLTSSFKVELGTSTIILVFKDEKYQLNDIMRNNSVMNMYIYEGLSRALYKFIQDNQNGMENEEFIELNSLSEQSTPLNQKLLDLMLNKGIEDIDLESIDRIISIISNNIIEKFVYSIREVSSNVGD